MTPVVLTSLCVCVFGFCLVFFVCWFVWFFSFLRHPHNPRQGPKGKTEGSSSFLAVVAVVVAVVVVCWTLSSPSVAYSIKFECSQVDRYVHRLFKQK